VISWPVSKQFSWKASGAYTLRSPISSKRRDLGGCALKKSSLYFALPLRTGAVFVSTTFDYQNLFVGDQQRLGPPTIFLATASVRAIWRWPSFALLFPYRDTIASSGLFLGRHLFLPASNQTGCRCLLRCFDSGVAHGDIGRTSLLGRTVAVADAFLIEKIVATSPTSSAQVSAVIGGPTAGSGLRPFLTRSQAKNSPATDPSPAALSVFSQGRTTVSRHQPHNCFHQPFSSDVLVGASVFTKYPTLCISVCCNSQRLPSAAQLLFLDICTAWRTTCSRIAQGGASFSNLRR